MRGRHKSNASRRFRIMRIFIYNVFSDPAGELAIFRRGPRPGMFRIRNV